MGLVGGDGKKKFLSSQKKSEKKITITEKKFNKGDGRSFEWMESHCLIIFHFICLNKQASSLKQDEKTILNLHIKKKKFFFSGRTFFFLGSPFSV